MDILDFPPADWDWPPVVKGTTVDFKASVILTPSATDAIEYFGELIVNGKNYGQFKYRLLPKYPGVSEGGVVDMVWPVKITGPREMTAELRLSAVGFLHPDKRIVFHGEVAKFPVRCNPKDFVLARFFQSLFHRCGYWPSW